MKRPLPTRESKTKQKMFECLLQIVRLCDDQPLWVHGKCCDAFCINLNGIGNYKTQMCGHCVNGKVCPHGKGCQRAHGIEDMLPSGAVKVALLEYISTGLHNGTITQTTITQHARHYIYFFQELAHQFGSPLCRICDGKTVSQKIKYIMNFQTQYCDSTRREDCPHEKKCGCAYAHAGEEKLQRLEYVRGLVDRTIERFKQRGLVERMLQLKKRQLLQELPLPDGVDRQAILDNRNNMPRYIPVEKMVGNSMLGLASLRTLVERHPFGVRRDVHHPQAFTRRSSPLAPCMLCTP